MMMLLFLSFKTEDTLVLSLCKLATLVHPIVTVESRARRLTVLALSRGSVMTASQDAGEEGVG